MYRVTVHGGCGDSTLNWDQDKHAGPDGTGLATQSNVERRAARTAAASKRRGFDSGNINEQNGVWAMNVAEVKTPDGAYLRFPTSRPNGPTQRYLFVNSSCPAF